MELEQMQSASETEPVGFQYDPRAKEPQVVRRRAFDLLYLVDDIGAGREVITDTRQIYQAIADSAYTQIFSDILGRQSSTADNDERDMNVADQQKYTKRNGAFGLSVLVVPDDDILDYCAHRYAVEALTRTFALPEDAPAAAPQDTADATRRDLEFLRKVEQEAGRPGEAGQSFRTLVELTDTAGTGTVDRFMRNFETTFAQRFERHLAGLPRWAEDKLLEFDEDPETIRSEMPKRFEAWRKFVDGARAAVDREAELIAGEVGGGEHEHSFAKVVGAAGPIADRLFLVRLTTRLGELMQQARAQEAAARQKLAAMETSHREWVERLAEAAPKTLTEYLRGNDYAREAVPEFMGWYRNNMEDPQLALLRSTGVVDLCEDLLKQIDRRRSDLGTLFGELVNIRAALLSRCDELLRYGVRRDQGGHANEHVLDVEVYQNYEDPEPFRMWHWVFESREREGDYDPAQISPAIYEAYRSVKRARHMTEAVCERLVAMGQERWRERIVGKLDATSLREVGLDLVSSLEEEARWALGWAKLRQRYGKGHGARMRELGRDWEVAQEGVRAADVEEYVVQKIQYAARKCAPFLRLAKERQATSIEPKRYVLVYRPYLDDERLRGALTANERFPVKGADVLPLDDPKRVVFYWSELGVPFYRIESLDEYYDRYVYVKQSELERGRVYRWDELPYQPRAAAALARHREGRKVPDIPLHIDKRWEGAPDDAECLAHVAQKAVDAKQGKLQWLEARAAVREQRASEELVQFELAQCFGLLTRREEDGQYLYANQDIPERDRLLGKFRDEVFTAFRGCKPAIREWLEANIATREEAFVKERDREGLKKLLGAHKELLGKLRLQLEGREQAFVEREHAAMDQALEALLAKM
jgi:hypothetical protein